MGARRRLVPMAVIAETYSIGERTLRGWIAEGRFPAYRVGTKSVRIDIDEFEAAMVVPFPKPVVLVEATRARARPLRRKGKGAA